MTQWVSVQRLASLVEVLTVDQHHDPSIRIISQLCHRGVRHRVRVDKKAPVFLQRGSRGPLTERDSSPHPQYIACGRVTLDLAEWVSTPGEY